MVVDGVVVPLVPDSVASSGPVQSGSAEVQDAVAVVVGAVRALRQDLDLVEVAAVGDVDLDPALADADDAARAGRAGSDRTRQERRG